MRDAGIGLKRSGNVLRRELEIVFGSFFVDVIFFETAFCYECIVFADVVVLQFEFT